MGPLQIVNLYIETDIRGPRRQDGMVIYILETQTSKGTVTRDKIIPIPDTTEHHLTLEALGDALGRLTRCCQVEVWLADRYVSDAICGGLLQQWQIRDWQTARKKPVTDADLWKEIAARMREHVVTLHPAVHHGYRGWMQGQLKKFNRERLAGRR